MEAKHSLLQRAHSGIITQKMLIGALVTFVAVFLLCATTFLRDGSTNAEMSPISPHTDGATPTTAPSVQPFSTTPPTMSPVPVYATSTSPKPTATAPPLTGMPKDLGRWATYTIPADWMECIRRNLQLDERGRPLHAVTEMAGAIPLLITPLTGDVRFFPYFTCSIDVPVRYHLVIQNERDAETVAAIDELQRRFGDSGRLLVIRNRYNRGYSGSMNQGFEWALKERSMAEVPWVFACGVDTIFEQGLLANMVKVVENNTLGDAAMLQALAEEVAMEERLVREGNFSYYERWAPRGRPLKVLRSGFPGVPLNVRTAPLMPDRVRYTVADENRENGSFSATELKSRFFGNYVASVTPIPFAVGTVVITRLALSTVGFFDENYFPAYMDDIDMRWRHFSYGFAAIFAEDYGTVRRWHHYNAPNLRGGGPFSDPILEKYGIEDNYSRRAFGSYLSRAKGLYDKLKHGPRDTGGVWRESVEKGKYLYTRFNVSRYPADTWVLDATVQECMFRHTYNYETKTWTRPWNCSYKLNTLTDSGVLGEEQLESYQAMLRAGQYITA
jgi:GT2 family glycosyltransferase